MQPERNDNKTHVSCKQIKYNLPILFHIGSADRFLLMVNYSISYLVNHVDNQIL